MDETLGKRIVSNRKRLGLTQDGLAERLGVTAQAVSKWENDQSCPDIAMLPKLAEIFGCSVDALLGCGSPPQAETVHLAEVVTEETENDAQENEGIHLQKGNWEFRWDGGKRGSISFALWVLLTGGMLLAGSILNRELSFWQAVWPSALLVFGLSGLYPKFSVFSLGCALFGGYFILDDLGLITFSLSGKLIFPICLLLFGLSLLIDALRKTRHGNFTVRQNGRTVSNHQARCTIGDESFDCATAFGENSHYIDLPRLREGRADLSFGELTVDLTGCEELSENCSIEANCSFGELVFLVPERFRVEPFTSTAFASFEAKGHPAPEVAGVITLEASVSFGQITVRYV